ncbi:MAG: cysteine desulfurase [Pseudomonadota bacterium]
MSEAVAKQAVEPTEIGARRADFPTLNQSVNGYPLVYLDNAASSQPARPVIEEMARYQSEDHANVHRGVHTLSHRATDLYEQARERVRRFLNAAEAREIIFTRGTTDSINLVASSYGQARLQPGDVVLLTELEHHSNIVPWQMVAETTGAEIRVAPVDDAGQVHADEVIARMDERVRMVAIAHVSNVLGTVLPVREIIAAAHERDIPVLLDGAQAVPHMPVDVRALDVDFYAFSGHKLFGPTGIGVLYGKESLLGTLPPYQGGGAMIESVSFDGTSYNELPYRFEAGTPNVSGAIGLGTAIDYLTEVGMPAVEAHVDGLLDYLTECLLERGDLRLIGTATEKASVQSFLLGDVHPHDLGTILDQQGIAVRTGHHCAMPLMRRFGLPGTVRASLALYNNRDDVDRFLAALDKARKIFAV